MFRICQNIANEYVSSIYSPVSAVHLLPFADRQLSATLESSLPQSEHKFRVFLTGGRHYIQLGIHIMLRFQAARHVFPPRSFLPHTLQRQFNTAAGPALSTSLRRSYLYGPLLRPKTCKYIFWNTVSSSSHLVRSDAPEIIKNNFRHDHLWLGGFSAPRYDG